jgi:hypothetical protein
MYLHLHADELWYHVDGAALAGCDAHDLSYADVRSKLSILKDIICLAPELQPLTSDYIKAVPLLPFGSLLRPIPGDLKEEGRRARIIRDERRELLEKVWAVRPVTNADYWEAERQVMASHPDWYFESAEERDERKAEAERKGGWRGLTAADREELAKMLAEMGYDRATRTWAPNKLEEIRSRLGDRCQVIGFGGPEEGARHERHRAVPARRR